MHCFGAGDDHTVENVMGSKKPRRIGSLMLFDVGAGTLPLLVGVSILAVALLRLRDGEVECCEDADTEDRANHVMVGLR